ncbi:MAG: hypothetical protein HLUCCA11_06305 [Phormidesmis priestleyi Ana]|uniref:Uncharacterized protein n=1 Tax=Phormidesmis priestleyi Ana TaxID=1666911 RepID=A0A0P7ZSK5_9CYAN|nr:MAG: hypothetical protein HLUCCA11_06305 [Phormidesmis priestleyi Ana]
MQYLAKVNATKESFTPPPLSATQMGGAQVKPAQIQLLAVNTFDQTWELIEPPRIITVSQPIAAEEHTLVLVELDADERIVAIEDATPWVLSFVSEYLTLGLTPKGLEEELERAEQWRQSLTLQSQEVRRRALETAARRDEIQDLEKRLKLERDELENSRGKKD